MGSTVLSSWDAIFKFLRSPDIDSKELIPPAYVARARIFKLSRSPRIDSKKPIPPGCVAWRAGTTTLFLLGSFSPHRLFKFPVQAGRYDNPIPTRFLAPIDCSQIPALKNNTICSDNHERRSKKQRINFFLMILWITHKSTALHFSRFKNNNQSLLSKNTIAMGSHTCGFILWILNCYRQ
jgi:hypothetical protein